MFDQIQAAERAGNLSPEEKKRLEEAAAEKGLQALFKGAKLEIESVLRETCDRVLGNPNLSSEQRHLRALALQIMGEAYLRAKRDGEVGPGQSDYLRMNSSASASTSAGAGAGSFSGTRERTYSQYSGQAWDKFKTNRG